MSVAGKISVITGGSRGIGREIALSFMKEGAQVVVLDIADELGAEEKAVLKLLRGLFLTTINVT